MRIVRIPPKSQQYILRTYVRTHPPRSFISITNQSKYGNLQAAIRWPCCALQEPLNGRRGARPVKEACRQAAGSQQYEVWMYSTPYGVHSLQTDVTLDDGSIPSHPVIVEVGCSQIAASSDQPDVADADPRVSRIDLLPLLQNFTASDVWLPGCGR